MKQAQPSAAGTPSFPSLRSLPLLPGKMPLNMQQGLMLLASSATPAITDPGILVGSVCLTGVVFEWCVAVQNMHDLILAGNNMPVEHDRFYNEPWLGVHTMR